MHTEISQRLAWTYSCGKDFYVKINLTIFITLWYYRWAHGLIFGEGIKTHYMQFKYMCVPERDNMSEYHHMLRLTFCEYDAYKVFQLNCMIAILLDFLTEKVKV